MAIIRRAIPPIAIAGTAAGMRARAPAVVDGPGDSSVALPEGTAEPPPLVVAGTSV